MSDVTTDQPQVAVEPDPVDSSSGRPPVWSGAVGLVVVAIVAGVMGWLIGRGGIDPEPVLVVAEQGDPIDRISPDDLVPEEGLDELQPPEFTLPDFFDRLREGAPPEFEEFLESLPPEFAEPFEGDPSRLFEEFLGGGRFREFFRDRDFGFPDPGQGFREQFDELRDSLGFDLPGFGIRPQVPDGYRLGGRDLKVGTDDGQVEFSLSMRAVGPEGEATIALTGEALDTSGDVVDLGGVDGYIGDGVITWSVADGRATASVSSDELSEEALLDLAATLAQTYR